MKPFYLKFEDEAQAIAALEQFRVLAMLDTDGELITPACWQTASLTHALDVVGVITKTDADGNAETLDGFHVNLMIDTLPNELGQFVVTPATPSRVFAGV